MRRGWRWSLAGVVGIVAVVSLFIIPALGTEPVMGDVGVLRLHLNSDGDKFVFDPVAAGSDQIQTLSQGNCKLSTTASLVSVVGAGANASKQPFAGLKDHRLGVGQKGEGTGEPCARINKDLGQSLTLSLAGTLDGAAIDYAEIDLGFKFDGDAELVLKRGGSNGTLVDTVTVPCNGQSDCGPDQGGNDNERVILHLAGEAPAAGDWQAFQVAGIFDTIVIKPGIAATSGVVSLEGGFNGSGPGPLGQSLSTNDTLFNIVEVFDGEIACGELAEPGATYDITRGDDTDGECKGPDNGLLYNFEAGSETVGGEVRLFVDFVTEPVDANTATVAQFLEVITWKFDAPPDVVGGEAQQRILYYDDHVGAGERVMPWCLKDPRPIGAGDPATILPPVPTGQIAHTSCLIDSESHVTMAGDFETVHTIYNIGDGKRGF